MVVREVRAVREETRAVARVDGLGKAGSMAMAAVLAAGGSEEVLVVGMVAREERVAVERAVVDRVAPPAVLVGWAEWAAAWVATAARVVARVVAVMVEAATAAAVRAAVVTVAASRGGSERAVEVAAEPMEPVKAVTMAVAVRVEAQAGLHSTRRAVRTAG